MIAVIGEVLLDIERYTHRRARPGDAIPVLREDATVHALGGAGNAAANAFSLGGRVGLWGPVGDDAEGRILETLLSKIDVTPYVTRLDGWTTPTRERIFDADRPVLRLDRERRVPPFEVAEGWQVARVVLCADYGLGLWTEALVSRVLAAGAAVVADARTPVAWWRGAALWCPNAREACAATGTTSLGDALEVARRALPGTVLAVTRDADGVAFDDGARRDLPAHGPPSVDAVGAGDTFTAAVAVGLAEGLAPLRAVTWAIRAAGLAAARRGTRVVSRRELA